MQYRGVSLRSRSAARGNVAKQGRFQLQLRRRVIESGEFYLVTWKLDGQGGLRVTLINPLTTEDHLDQLLETLRRHGRVLLDDRSGVVGAT